MQRFIAYPMDLLFILALIYLHNSRWISLKEFALVPHSRRFSQFAKVYKDHANFIVQLTVLSCKSYIMQ